jgi:hydrogenase maturation protein HypF
MLPYAPLHDMLFFYPDGDRPNFNALVMTSGNISGEPIIKDNDDALEKLKDICDAFLLHNRDIFMRVDDSVIRIKAEDKKIRRWEDKKSQPLNLLTSQPLVFVRRARGYAPNPIKLPFNVPPLVACGAELKSTFTIAKDISSVVSQHLGDMDNYETLRFFEETLSNLKAVFNIEPEFIFYDMHPDYIITRWAKETGMKGFEIQHHEAHIAACIAENSLEGNVIGIALDGTGYGRDGNIWGGEIFIGNLNNFKRVAHLKYIPMPGGEMAIKEPWRMAVSALITVGGDNLDYVVGRWETIGAEKIIELMKRKINSPLTSSCGRLFDAAASIIAGFDNASFEAEAAIGLEALASNHIEGTYSYDIVLEDENNPGHKNSVIPEVLNRESTEIKKLERNSGGMIIIDFKNTFNEILDDMKKGEDKETMASLFHNTVASGITDAVIKISQSSNIKDVCLSGGVFQNEIFIERLSMKLMDADMNVFTQRLLPPNDGNISFGQAAIGGWRVRCA